MENYPNSTLCFLSLLILFASLMPAQSQLLPIVDDDHGARLQTYIVHVLDPEGAEFVRAEDRESWHRSFLPNTTLDSGEQRLVYSYRDAIGGFAARLTPEEAKAMEAIDGFLYARPERELIAQTTYTPDFLGLNQWNGLWYNTSFGTGMIIGVIDTGVTPAHPSFRDDGMPLPPRKWRGSCDFRPPAGCSNKLIGATAFKSGLRPSPLDDHGHGTHTASTAAGTKVYDAEVVGQARGTASGTAPGAHLAIYKVLYNNRGQESDFIAGIDQAIHDGVDVLSMSLGFAKGEHMYRSSIAITSFSAITRGIVPSCCAMNEGPFPSVLSNDAPWCLTVGASTVDRRIAATVVLGNGMEIDGESAYQPFSSTGPLDVVYPGINGPADVANCNTLPASVKGKMVVCLYGGGSSSTQKGENVKATGGAAMIIFNQRSLGLTTFAEPHVLPASHVSSAGAEKIVAYLRTTASPTASIVFKGTQFGARPTPAVASFSSRGPSLYNGGIIKPDIIAPGVNILAAWPIEVGPNPSGKSSTFNFESGTSMATPHVSGIVAMLKENHPQWSPAAIKSAIMTSAYAVDSEGGRITDQYTGSAASFFAMGAGHVNPAKANDPGLVYDLQPVDYIPYLCGLYPTNTNRIVSMIVRQRVDCGSIRKISAQQLNYPSIAVTLGLRPAASAIVLTRTVTNVGDAVAVYAPQIIEPQGVRVDLDTASLSFSSQYEQRSFRIQLTNRYTTSRRGQVSEGFLKWVSGHHVVTTPISVTFT